MEQMTNAEAFQFWVVGFCIAVTVVILTVTALWVTWKRQPGRDEPPKDDPARQVKINQRLAQLAQQTHPDHRDRLRRAS